MRHVGHAGPPNLSAARRRFDELRSLAGAPGIATPAVWENARGRPGTAPGMGPGMAPGMGPGMAPGMGPGMAPGMGPGMAPGMGPGMAPGMGQGMAPGMGQGMAPGVAFAGSPSPHVRTFAPGTFGAGSFAPLGGPPNHGLGGHPLARHRIVTGRPVQARMPMLSPVATPAQAPFADSATPAILYVAMVCAPDNLDAVALALSMIVEARTADEDQARMVPVRIHVLASGLTHAQVAELYEAGMSEGRLLDHTELLVIPDQVLPTRMVAPELTAFALALQRSLDEAVAGRFAPHVVLWSHSVLALRDPFPDLYERAATSPEPVVAFHPADPGAPAPLTADIILVAAPRAAATLKWVESAHRLIRDHAKGRELRATAMLAQMASLLKPAPVLLDAERYTTPMAVEHCREADVVLTVPASVA